MWLRDTDRGLPSFNFQGIGVNPWMQPRLDPSMGNYQTEMYQTMAAAALQDMWALDPSKQHPTSSIQFQQQQNFPNRNSPLMQTQMLQQQSQPQQGFPNIQENPHPSQSQSQAQTQTQFQQHLQRQHSFNNQNQHHLLQQQQQQPQPQQQQPPQLRQQQQPQLQQQQVVDHQQIPSVVSTMSQYVSAPQSQPPPMQAITSLGHQQSFSDSNGNPATTAIVSPLHSILSSFPQDETSHLLNLPRSTSWVPVQPSTAWPPSKCVSVDPLLSSGASQCVLPQMEQLGQPQSTMAQNAITLPPFPGRECAIEGSTDPQNHLLFGVNIEPSSLLMHNGLSSLKGVNSNSDSPTIPFQSSNYMNTSGTDSSLNPGMPHNIGESGFLQTPDNGGQGDPSNKTFVKVSLSSRSILSQIEHFNLFPLLCCD